MKSYLYKLTQIYILILACMLGTSCSSKVSGSLLVTAPEPGEFEVYRYDSEGKLFTEWRGLYNKILPLPAGRYLLVSPCSSKNIVIAEGEKRVISTHVITFSPPQTPSPRDKFLLECRRKMDTQYSLNRLVNQFQVVLFGDDQDILVNMQPLHKFMPKSPKSALDSYKIQLGAVKVSQQNTQSRDRYFIQPKTNTIASTEGQRLNYYTYLLPGPYTVELNGTRQDIHIKPNELLDIKSGQLTIIPPRNINLQSIAKINGKPVQVKLDKKYNLRLNTRYALLPGKHYLGFSGSQKNLEMTIHPGQHQLVRTKSVMVTLSCPQQDWSCLGKKEIFLYEPGSIYPFVAGTTDVPVLFWQKDVSISIAGMDSIRYKLSPHSAHSVIKTQRVTLRPKLKHSTELYTELVRLEGASSYLKGVSYDLPIKEKLELVLLTGRYQLTMYQKDRRNSLRRKTSTYFYAQPQAQPMILRPTLFFKALKTSQNIKAP